MSDGVDAIASDLSRLDLLQAHLSVKAGVALYFAYFAQLGRDEYYSRAVELLDAAIAECGASAFVPSLYGGATGLAWVVDHVNGLLGEPNASAHEVTEDIESALIGCVDDSTYDWQYDLIIGLVGVGVYFLQRLPSSTAADGLSRVISRLIKSAHHAPRGTTWLTKPSHLPEWERRHAPNGWYNLGLAHGVPGVIGLLSAALAKGIDVPGIREVLERTVAWVVSCEQSGEVTSHFPNHVLPEPGGPKPSRVAWCYGDPGVAVSLLAAGCALKQSDLCELALDVLDDCGHRPNDQGRIQDAGLCHGSAGVGHIYNVAYHATGDPRMLEAARRAFGHTLAMRSRAGYGGFQSYRPRPDADRPNDPMFIWENDPSFLTGSAGIGLALLATISARPPDWDQLLLLSIKGTTAGICSMQATSD